MKPQALFYIVTTVFLAGLSASLYAILNNQFTVSKGVWYTFGFCVVGTVTLITIGWFTTNETIAFRR